MEICLRLRATYSQSNVLKESGFKVQFINRKRIISHNLKFTEIDLNNIAEVILAIIDTVFASYWFEQGLTNENIFDIVLTGKTNIIDQLQNQV